MTLLLDGHKVNGKSLKVTANLRIESKDLSGQTSNTDTAHTGFKPKSLTVSLLIPYRDSQHLTDLMRLAEATAGGGQLKTYRLVNNTAAAFGVRQVQFSDTSAAERTTTSQPGGCSSPSVKNFPTPSACRTAAPAAPSTNRPVPATAWPTVNRARRN